MSVIYAIGDIHGEDEKLARLHEYIFDDAAFLGVTPEIIHLGDLIDRGPDSRGVVARIMRLHEKGAAATLKGNHEEMMLSAFDTYSASARQSWAHNGGEETIASYERVHGVRTDWRDTIDSEHVDWLRALPAMIRRETFVFVHAGIDPWRFPNDSDEVKLWTRARVFFESEDWPERPELEGLTVIHGHTPTDDFRPEIGPRRINVDTGVCYGGPLTSVVLATNERPRFLSVAPR